MTTGLPLMKSVLTPLAKSILVPLGLSGVMSAVDAAIQKKIYGSGCHSDLASRTAALTISNKKMENIMKIVKSLEKSGLLIKGIGETIKNEAKEGSIHQEGFICLELEFHRTDQQCFVEDVSFLWQVPSLLL